MYIPYRTQNRGLSSTQRIFDYTFVAYMLCVYMYNVNFYSHHAQDGKTALHYAAEGGHTEVVKYLLENTTAQVNAKNDVSHLKVFVCANKNCTTKYSNKL